MSNHRPLVNRKGFTIIELMIATAVFSVVLLVTSTGVIAIGRAYYKSLTTSRVHESLRSIMDDVSRSLQFAKSDSINSLVQNDDGTYPLVKTRCFGSDRYRYVLNQKVTGPVSGTDNIGLYRDKRASTSTCDDSGDYDHGTQLLGNNMRLLEFYVSSPPDPSDPYQISVKIAYGDDDLLSIYNNDGHAIGWTDPIDNPAEEAIIAGALCKSGIIGSNFCATGGLETTVSTRVE